MPLIAITPPVQAVVSGRTDVRVAVMPAPEAVIIMAHAMGARRPPLVRLTANPRAPVHPMNTIIIRADIHVIIQNAQAAVRTMAKDVRPAVIHRQVATAATRSAITEKHLEAVMATARVLPRSAAMQHANPERPDQAVLPIAVRRPRQPVLPMVTPTAPVPAITQRVRAVATGQEVVHPVVIRLLHHRPIAEMLRATTERPHQVVLQIAEPALRQQARAETAVVSPVKPMQRVQQTVRRQLVFRAATDCH